VPVKIENWSIFRKDRDKSLWLLIFGSPCMLFKTCLEPGFEKVTDIFGSKKCETCGRLARSVSVEIRQIDVFGLRLFVLRTC